MELWRRTEGPVRTDRRMQHDQQGGLSPLTPPPATISSHEERAPAAPRTEGDVAVAAAGVCIG